MLADAAVIAQRVSCKCAFACLACLLYKMDIKRDDDEDWGGGGGLDECF